MSSPDRPSRYRAYLLRLWKAQSDGELPAGGWRCSLEDPHTGERRGFPTLDLLLAFLNGELADHRGSEPALGPETDVA
jgi:hypothetical protein